MSRIFAVRTVFPVALIMAVIGATLIYLNIPFFRDNSAWLKPVIVLVFCLLLLLQIAKSKAASSFTPFEVCALAFIFYKIIISFFQDVYIGSLAYPLLAVALYYGSKTFLLSRKASDYGHLLFWSIIVLHPIYLLALFFSDKPGSTIDYLFLPNVSVFSILLAAQLSFIVPFYYYYKQNSSALLKWLLLFEIAVSLVLIIATQGRSGWIGLFLASVYILYQYGSGFRVKEKLFLYGCLAFLILVPLAVWYKWNSSAGRLLIYKVSFRMLHDNCLTGIGTGQFRNKYNQYQGNYFADADIDSREALLADNTFYAFNDPLQLLIENGITGFLLCAVAVVLLILQIKNIRSVGKHIPVSAVASLISIGAASLFLYPFHVFPITVHCTFCLALLNVLPGSQRIALSPFKAKAFKAVFIFFDLLLLIHFFFVSRYQLKSKAASDLAASGYKNAAIQQYEILGRSYVKDGRTMYLYAQELYNTARLSAVPEVTRSLKKYYCTNDVYRLSGAAAQELGLNEEAERDYRTAIYMTPNRMRSRYDLFQYYLSVQDTVNAIYWGRSILTMPVKIPSAATFDLREKSAGILNSLTSE